MALTKLILIFAFFLAIGVLGAELTEIGAAQVDERRALRGKKHRRKKTKSPTHLSLGAPDIPTDSPTISATTTTTSLTCSNPMGIPVYSVCNSIDSYLCPNTNIALNPNGCLCLPSSNAGNTCFQNTPCQNWILALTSNGGDICEQIPDRSRPGHFIPNPADPCYSQGGFCYSSCCSETMLFCYKPCVQ